MSPVMMGNTPGCARYTIQYLLLPCLTGCEAHAMLCGCLPSARLQLYDNDKCKRSLLHPRIIDACLI